jgi:hypothetical protein
MLASSPGKYVVKGSVLRAYLAVLAKTPHAAATVDVLTTLDPEAARLMREPPLAGTWVDGIAFARIIEALHRCGGDAAVLAVAHDALEQQTIRSLTLMVQGILRVFATSPVFLLSRFGELIRTTSRGIVMEWTSLSERSGRMQVTHETDVPLPAPCFLTTIPALERMVALCNVKANVSRPELRAHNVSRYLLDW